MWGTKTIERAWHRLGHAAAPEVPPAAVEPSASVDPAPVTISIAFTRPEKVAFAAALAARLGGETQRLDTPARVASALMLVIDRVGGTGRPHVVRKPAGLYTPEHWHISIHGADEAARAEIERLAAKPRID